MSEIDSFLDGKTSSSGSGGSEIDSFLDEPPNSPGLGARVRDSAIALGTGIVSGVQSFTNLGGADNSASQGLGKFNETLSSFESDARKEERRARADKIKQAERSGSTWEEVKANVGAFTEAPLDTTLNAVGSTLPTLATSLIPGVGQAALGARIAQFGVGAAQGLGAVKGAQFDAAKQKHLESGATVEQATQRAASAQAYTADNAGDLALGAILGGVAGTSGAEGALGRVMARRAGQEAAEKAAPGILRATLGGALKEAPTEALQGGQERLASNRALQREGFDTPTWEGVAGQAALEGVAGGVVGGGFGAVESGGRTRQQNIDQLRQRLQGQQDAQTQEDPAQAPTDPVPLLGNAPPDRLFAFPDGTVGRTGEVESYLANLPEDQRADARARLMGRSYTEVNDLQAQQARRWWENYGDGQPVQPSPDYLGEVQAAVRSGTPFTTQQTVETVRSAMEDAWLAQNIAPNAPAAAESAEVVGEQLQGEFEQVGGDTALAAVDARVRTGRVLGGLQNILDAGADNTLQVLNRLSTSLTRIGEQPLTGEEAGRVRRIVDAYMGFRGVGEPAPLPTLAPPAVDQFADNASMEALIPERPSRAMGLDPAAGSLSAAAVTAVDSGASQTLFRQAVERIRAERANANPQAQARQTQSAQADAARDQASAPVGSNGAAVAGLPGAGNPAAASPGLMPTSLPAPTQEAQTDGPQADQAQQATSQQRTPQPPTTAVGAEVAAVANEAATSDLNDLPQPTQAQKLAGNYRKAHLKFDGLDLTVENPVGSTRSGVDPNGQPWSVDMVAHYGYMKRTKGADGDQVDVYLANDPRPGSPVFVFDQFNADGTFDEHKAVAGVATQAEAEAIYDAHFSDGSGPRRRRGVTDMPVADFKTWAASEEAAKGPAAGASAEPAVQSATAQEGQTNDQTAATTASTPDSTESSSVRDAGTPADGEAAQTDGAAARGDATRPVLLEGGPIIDAEMVRRIFTPMPTMSVEEARVAVMGMAKDWRNGPTVRVVAKPGDLPGNRAPDTRGLYLNGVAYIVAGRHHSSRALLATLAHEVIAHHGLRTMLGGVEWERAMRNIQQGLERGDAALVEIRDQIRGAYRDEAGNFNLSPDQEADEIAARAVELGFDAGAGEFRTEYEWVKRAYSRIAQFLRNLGFYVRFTNAELQGMLARAQRFLADPAKGNGFVVGDEQVAGAMARDVSSELDTAVIGHDLGAANNHPRYAAAKAGDVDAAVDVAKSLVTPEFVAKVRAAIGDTQPVVVPVVAEEAAGRNKIPRAAAMVLAKELGLQFDRSIMQANTPRRTGLDGIGRIFSPVEFDGQVNPGQTYLLLDDTLTQGGTFKSLASFIEAGGGRVVGAVALTGKQYSAKIGLTPSTLQTLREKHGASETDFRAATGYGFDALTESEARYLANFKPADALRARIAEEGRRSRDQADRGAAGPVDSGGAEARGPSPVEAKASTEAGVPRQWETPASERFDNVVYKLQDKLIDTKRVQEAIRAASGQIGDDFNVYLQEELFHGRAASRVKAFADRELLPLFNQMRAAGLEISDVEEFLHARHAREANALIAERDQSMRDGGSGMTNAAADAYMQALSGGQRRKLEAAAAKVDAIINSTRQLYADYGLEDQATVDGWGQMFQHYVPLMREDKDGGMGVGQGFSIKGKEVKGRTGSTRKVVDILANVAAQRERVIVRGEKNRVARALVGLAQANPNPQFWEVRSQPPTERVYDAARDMVVERPDSMFKQRPNVITAKVRDSRGNVTEQAVVLNEDNPRAMRMAEALKNLDAGALEGILGVSAKITRFFAAVNTQWNVVFGPVNLVRDLQGAMVNLSATPLADHRLRIAADTFRALGSIYRDLRAGRNGKVGASPWSGLWQQMQEDGGTTGFRDQFRTSAERAEALQRVLTPDGWAESNYGRFFTADGRLRVPLEHARQGVRWLFDWLSDYNDALENGVRLATYKAALDNGMSREQAASMAKNITVNFNRRGQVGLQAGALFAFFNSAMQGTARIGQTIFDMDNGNPKTLRLSSVGKKVVYGGVTLGALQALLLSAAGFDDDDPPEFVRERALIIPTGGKQYISIPMPLGLHVLPGIGRHMTEFTMSGFEKPQKRVVDMLGMLVDAFNPIGNAGLSIQTIAPTALDPLVALSENRDWNGRPIARKSSNPALPGHMQAKDTATSWARLMSEGINTLTGGNKYVAGVFSPTPDQIDYLIAQVTGGVGRELSKLEQTVRASVSGEELPTHKIPLIGRFVGDADSQASQGSAFYANLNRLNELETEIKGLRKDGRSVDAARLMRERPEARLIQMANRSERRVQELRREKRALVEKGADKDVVRATEARITAEMQRLNQAAERAREAVR
jgi:hypothetical protein